MSGRAGAWQGGRQEEAWASSQSTSVCGGGGELRNKGMRAEVHFLLWGLGLFRGTLHFPLLWEEDTFPLGMSLSTSHEPQDTDRPAFGLN